MMSRYDWLRVEYEMIESLFCVNIRIEPFLYYIVLFSRSYLFSFFQTEQTDLRMIANLYITYIY